MKRNHIYPCPRCHVKQNFLPWPYGYKRHPKHKQDGRYYYLKFYMTKLL
jgi:hypothetical protein